MPDQASRPGDSKSRSPTKSPKTMRSLKIQADSPTIPSSYGTSYREDDDDDDDDDDSEANDHAPSILRSHTPGHLASKSNDRRRKPAELALRQRSQSVASTSTSASTSHVSMAPLPTSKTPAAPSNATGGRTPQKNGDDAQAKEKSDPPGLGESITFGGTLSRRHPGLRSTSAMATSKPAGSAPTSGSSLGIRHASSSRFLHSGRGTYTAFPPLADPKNAVDVPAAPASGMYWSQAPVSGSPHTALRAHTTTLIGSNVYVFGGCDSRACFNELYVLDADSFHWSTPHVVGELPVPLRAMTCTAVGKKLVIFGGGDGPAYYNDIYILDTVNYRWSRPRIVGDKIPSKRRAHTACLYKNGIYVFGGGDGIRALNDIWRLDVSDTTKVSWKMIASPSPDKSSPPGTKDMLRPKARGYHTANMVGSKLIIFGGSDGGECFNDVWVYDVEMHGWKQVTIPITYRRLSHTATIVGSYLFIIGGHDGNEYANDVLLLNLVTMAWDRRKVYGMPPSGRGYHGTVLHDSRLLMIGGFDGSEVFGDVWILELAVHSYYSQISHFSIEV